MMEQCPGRTAPAHCNGGACGKTIFVPGKTVLLLLLLMSDARSASNVAQSMPDAGAYPSHPIRLLVPFPPGASPNDIIGRLIGRQLADSMGQQVVVDNRAGAGGTIGANIVAKSNPDGYTILITSTTFTISPNVYRQLPYDSQRDFQPMTTIASAPMMLFVHPSVPASNVKEFIAYARSKPGQMNFGSGGNGTVPHFAGEMLKSMAGIQMNHIPYKGGAPAITALLGGEITVYIDTPTAMLQFVQQGKAKVLAVAGKQRSALLPDLPTLDEAGVPGYEMQVWYGFFAPAKTPLAIARKIYGETQKALEVAEVKSRLAAIGTQPGASPPDEFQRMFRAELEKWRKLAREVGIKPE